MSRDVKWKLAIFAGISEYLVYAEAKYCAFEMQGEPKYYVCPRTEYCCNFGCCVSPGFQIYHLWYYWLLVIIMFLVCSGGGWWYRYWLQGRYRAAASSIPSRSSTSRTQNPLRGPTCHAQQARISYNTARNTVLLHRMWKGPHRSASSPAYNGAAASSTHYQNTSVILNDNNCPYYQLYGPPPSYETVIAQTRGKISSPTSPDHSRLQSTVLQTPSIPPCFTHSYSPSRINGILENPNFRGTEANPNQHIDGFDTAYPHLAGATSLLRRQDFCILRRPINFGRLSACSEPENPLRDDNSSPEKYSIQRIDCASGSREHSHCEVCAEESIIKMQGRSEPRVECRVHRKPELSRSSTTVTIPSDLDDNLEKCERGAKLEWGEKSERGENSERGEKFERSGKCERGETPRVQGGSLKLFRNSDRKNLCPRFYEVVKNERSSGEKNSIGQFLKDSGNVENSGDLNSARVATTSDTTNSIEPSRHNVPQSTSSFQSNPSNNVILAPFTSNAVNNSPLPNNFKENDQHRLLTARQGSTSLNLESKCKLDRSRSLD